MSDLLACCLVVVVLVLAAGVVSRRFSDWERRWLWVALLAHIVAAFAHVFAVQEVLGGGDMLAYHQFGILLADMLRESPIEASWLLLQEIFHKKTFLLPADTLGGSTGAMFAISGFVAYFANDSLWAACILVSGVSLLGRLALYRAIRSELHADHQRRAFCGCLLVPSVVFWSSGLLKESIATAGLGFAVFGGHVVATKRGLLRGLPALVVGTCAVIVVKPYLLLPAGVAAGLWLHFDGHRPRELRRARTFRFGSAIVGAGVALSVLLGVGRIFPQFDVASLADETARMQSLVDLTYGNTDYELADGRTATLAGQISVIPVALATALFRPTLTDIKSPQIAIAAAETLVAALLLLWVLFTVGPLEVARRIRSEPILVFSVVLALGIAVGVGLATTNLGSLSRYRAPMMPFYAVTLLVLARRARPISQPANVAPPRGAPGAL